MAADSGQIEEEKWIGYLIDERAIVADLRAAVASLWARENGVRNS